ncbi:putative insulin-like growth factor 2 mRNA-binding protein [Sesbania bispinosa]|nr:putative insulin-like growth factor 2 mRNA-binding protein [Sesbania bispinosa]
MPSVFFPMSSSPCPWPLRSLRSSSHHQSRLTAASSLPQMAKISSSRAPHSSAPGCGLDSSYKLNCGTIPPFMSLWEPLLSCLYRNHSFMSLGGV